MILISIFAETTQVCFPGGLDGKEPTCNAGEPRSIPGSEDPLEEEMATHCSILAWKIPWKGGAWQATVHGVAKSQTRLSMHAHHRHQRGVKHPTSLLEGLIMP